MGRKGAILLYIYMCHDPEVDDVWLIMNQTFGKCLPLASDEMLILKPPHSQLMLK